MKILTIIAVSLFCFILAVPTMAQTDDPKVTINLKDLPPDVAAQVLAAQELAENGPPVPSQTAAEVAEEWVSFVDKFGDAIVGIAEKIGVTVNEFVKTPVGIFTAIMIFQKIMGPQLWSAVGGTFAWMVIVAILWRSFSHFHMNKKITLRDKPRWKGGNITEVKFVPCYEFRNGDYQTGSVWAHGVAFALITITCLCIVF